MTKLWQKGYSVNAQVERYEAAQNSALDVRLIRHDVWGSLAHVAMLKRIGVLSEEEHQALQQALCSILELEATHQFTVLPSDEDVHTSVENFLVTAAGPAGKKVHTARSRNDQVLLDLRLYGKEELLTVSTKLFALCSALLEFAEAYKDIPMPGYTHMQRAMLSSFGLWSASFAEALLDDEQLLSAAFALNDQSPLGSAAGYGVPLPIDRQFVADTLGFSRVQNNVIYVQNSRGKVEAAIVQTLTQIMLDLSKLAQATIWTTRRPSAPLWKRWTWYRIAWISAHWLSAISRSIENVPSPPVALNCSPPTAPTNWRRLPACPSAIPTASWEQK